MRTRISFRKVLVWILVKHGISGITVCAFLFPALFTFSDVFESADPALSGVHVDNIHGINGFTPEDTMRNMGLIASVGRTMTEKTILEIQQSKLPG